jgi:hypothetical protein
MAISLGERLGQSVMAGVIQPEQRLRVVTLLLGVADDDHHQVQVLWCRRAREPASIVPMGPTQPINRAAYGAAPGAVSGP